MSNRLAIPGASFLRTAGSPARFIAVAGFATLLISIVPAVVSIEAARPAGLELRLVEASDAADPFSPGNGDGRFDLNTLRVVVAVGPLGPVVRNAPAPGDDPVTIRRDPVQQGAVVQLHYEVAPAGGAPAFVADLVLPFTAPLDLVYLPVGRGGVAPFARTTTAIPWDGRDTTGALVADGDYASLLEVDLVLQHSGRSGAHGAAVEMTGSITVDNTAPVVETFFPPPVSLTDTTTVTARGRATDPSGVASVRVNGRAAPGPLDAAGWSITIDLLRGDNTLQVVAEDAVGNRTEAPFASLHSEDALLCQPLDVAHDPLRDRALLGDVALHAVIAVDLASGERRVLSGAGTGNGPVLPRPTFIAADRARDRLLVLGVWPETNDEALVAVDPVSGDRTLVSNPLLAGGPPILTAWDAAIDEAGGRLLVCDRNGDALIGIDLATGERSLVSGVARGAGPPLGRPYSLAVDPVRGVAFVARAEPERALLAVDLDSGDRALVATSSPSIPLFNWAIQEILIDPISGRLLTTSPYGPVTSFDPDSGEHIVLSDAGAIPPVGGGPELLAVRGLAFDALRERLLLADERHDALLTVQIATGDRNTFSGKGVGTGPPILFSTAHGLALDGAGDRLFYPERGSLWAVDLATGNRVVVSAEDRGAGPMLERPADVEYDRGSDVIYLGDWMSDAVYRVDPATGDRRVVTGAGIGGGAPLTNPKSLAIDVEGGRLLIEDGDCLILARLDNGDRLTLAERGAGSIPDKTLHGAEWDLGSGCFITAGCKCGFLPGLLIGIDPGSGHGDLISAAASGPLLSRPIELALDPLNHRALVIDRDIEGIIAVDLITGDRTMLSGPGIGFGPPLLARAIEVDAARQVAFVSNYVRYELIAVDMVSGDRVIVAK